MMVRVDSRLIELINEISDADITMTQFREAYRLRMEERGTPTTKQRREMIVKELMEQARKQSSKQHK